MGERAAGFGLREAASGKTRSVLLYPNQDRDPVIVGILSDTHGQRERARRAIGLLQRLGAEAFVHCGDIGGAAVLEEMVGLRAWVVCGNTDCPDSALLRYAATLDLTISELPLRFELSGRSIAVFHGHEQEITELIDNLRDTRQVPAAFGKCDYVLFGHTHVACESRIGSLHLINPGALHRAPVYTVATLDLAQDEVQFWRVADGETEDSPHAYRPRRGCMARRL